MCNPIGDNANLNITAINEHFSDNMDKNRQHFEQPTQKKNESMFSPML